MECFWSTIQADPLRSYFPNRVPRLGFLPTKEMLLSFLAKRVISSPQAFFCKKGRDFNAFRVR